MRLLINGPVDPAVISMVNFAAGYCMVRERLTFTVTNDGSAKMSNGQTVMVDKKIEISLKIQPKLSRWPFLTREVDTVPWVEIRSFEEEVVFVAAHELRHADQMAVGAFLKHQVPQAEADAERFATAVLEAYRTNLLT